MSFTRNFLSEIHNQRKASLKTVNIYNYDPEFEQLTKLLQAIFSDPVINKKVIKILKMESYQRRFVLNSWLEQLRIRHAPVNLLDSLSCLFDDKNAKNVLALLNNQQLKERLEL